MCPERSPNPRHRTRRFADPRGPRISREAEVLTLAEAAAYLRVPEAERDLAGVMAVPIDTAAAPQFDKLRRNKKLKRIGRADLLIASIARAGRAALVTRNVEHFRQVPGLPVENWAD